MNNENSVHLDGLVESCRIVGNAAGLTVARVSVVSVHPREEGREVALSPSVRYDRIHHLVRVSCSGEDAARLAGLSDRFDPDREPDGLPFIPCSVDGVLRSVSGEPLVDVSGKDFVLTDSLRTSENNVAKISGNVISLSHTGESARLELKTPAGNVTSIVFRSTNPSGWDAIASGRVRVGDPVYLSGPVISNEMVSGEERMRFCCVVPHEFVRLKLDKKRERGVSMG